MSSLETELITALWDGPKTGDELLKVFSLFIGNRCVSFQETMNGLVEQGLVYHDGYDENHDEVYIVTEAGVNAVSKRIYGMELVAGGKVRKKRH